MSNQVVVSYSDALREIDRAVASAPLSRDEHVRCQQIIQGLAARLKLADEMAEQLNELEGKTEEKSPSKTPRGQRSKKDDPRAQETPPPDGAK